MACPRTHSQDRLEQGIEPGCLTQQVFTRAPPRETGPAHRSRGSSPRNPPLAQGGPSEETASCDGCPGERLPSLHPWDPNGRQAPPRCPAQASLALSPPSPLLAGITPSEWTEGCSPVPTSPAPPLLGGVQSLGQTSTPQLARDAGGLFQHSTCVPPKHPPRCRATEGFQLTHTSSLLKWSTAASCLARTQHPLRAAPTRRAPSPHTSTVALEGVPSASGSASGPWSRLSSPHTRQLGGTGGGREGVGGP